MRSIAVLEKTIKWALLPDECLFQIRMLRLAFLNILSLVYVPSASFTFSLTMSLSLVWKVLIFWLMSIWPLWDLLEHRWKSWFLKCHIPHNVVAKCWFAWWPISGLELRTLQASENQFAICWFYIRWDLIPKCMPNHLLFAKGQWKNKWTYASVLD